MRSASILIRTLNEEAELAATLDAVFAQADPLHEVFIIDSGSTDRTLTIARRYSVTIIEIPQEEWSYPGALNVGATAATGEILVCLSAHCLPVGPEWLGSLLRHFDDERVAGVWGPSHRPNRPLPPGAPMRHEHGSYTIETRMWGMSNANAALRRALWGRHPFDERLPAAEDKAWGRDMMREGYVIVYEPTAAVIHGRHTAANAYKRNRAIMEGFRIMFPELDRPAAGSWRRALRSGMRIMGRHLSDPNPRLLWHDVKQGLSTMSAVVGGYAGARRRAREEAQRRPAAEPPDEQPPGPANTR